MVQSGVELVRCVAVQRSVGDRPWGCLLNKFGGQRRRWGRESHIEQGSFGALICLDADGKITIKIKIKLVRYDLGHQFNKKEMNE